MLLLDGAPKGDFNFSFRKKNAPAFLLLHGFLLGQKNNISQNIQNVWLNGIKFRPFVFIFSFIK